MQAEGRCDSFQTWNVQRRLTDFRYLQRILKGCNYKPAHPVIRKSSLDEQTVCLQDFLKVPFASCLRSRVPSNGWAAAIVGLEHQAQVPGAVCVAMLWNSHEQSKPCFKLFDVARPVSFLWDTLHLWSLLPHSLLFLNHALLRSPSRGSRWS
jgi:hypothetical protein